MSDEPLLRFEMKAFDSSAYQGGRLPFVAARSEEGTMTRWFACLDCGNTERLSFPADKYATDRLHICCSGCGQDDREYMRLFGDLTGDHSFGFDPS